MMIGQQGSFTIGTDTYPVTVVEVSKSGHKVTVQTDQTVRFDSDYQGVEFARDPRGHHHTFTRRQDGRYLLVGKPCGRLHVTGWFSYMDPHF